MFKRYLIGLLSSWGVGICVCVWLLNLFSPQAYETYQHLMSLNAQNKKEKGEKERRFVKQTRDQVSKQIFYKKDAQRLQSRLMSESSVLIWDTKGEGAELVEHFNKLSCAMQDKLIDDHSQQTIRYVKAQEALYSYKTGQLEAKHVEIAHYLISETLWPVSFDSFQPFFQGQAQKLQLSLLKEPNLKAEGFQAVLNYEDTEW